MAQTTDRRTRPWIAFVAGAVATLAIVLVWLAWNRVENPGAFRADIALPRAELPDLPTAPPPQGPRLPKLPLPTPR
jgi:hypothetical protein